MLLAARIAIAIEGLEVVDRCAKERDKGRRYDVAPVVRRSLSFSRLPPRAHGCLLSHGNGLSFARPFGKLDGRESDFMKKFSAPIPFRKQRARERTSGIYCAVEYLAHRKRAAAGRRGYRMREAWHPSALFS